MTTMKRIAFRFMCPLIGALLMTSCLADETVIEPSSTVALLSFSIQDLKTVHTIQKEDGTDSTYTTVMNGRSVKFTIDQANRRVYNVDSIAYGTNVSRVLVNVTADGAVNYVKADETLGSVEDSIDFNTPVTFRVTSYDGQFKRDYMVSVNTHQVDPKKTSWKQFENTNFPAFVEQKAFVKGDTLYVIGRDADGIVSVASTATTNGSEWATTTCSGIEGAGLSALLVVDTFYLKTDARLYRSSDATEWSIVEDETKVSILPTDTVDISRGVALFRHPLRTNPDIMRTIFVATPEVAADTCAQVWTKLDTEKWVEIGSSGNNVYGCPNLENLAVIEYADRMYAFGGQGLGNRKIKLEAFSNCYESRDHGVTWKKNEETFSLPEAFEGRNEAFSTATDGEYVWVMWSNGEVWRGRWNGVK